jgi:hypothetical protein
VIEAYAQNVTKSQDFSFAIVMGSTFSACDISLKHTRTFTIGYLYYTRARAHARKTYAAFWKVFSSSGKVKLSAYTVDMFLYNLYFLSENVFHAHLLLSGFVSEVKGEG